MFVGNPRKKKKEQQMEENGAAYSVQVTKDRIPSLFISAEVSKTTMPYNNKHYRTKEQLIALWKYTQEGKSSGEIARLTGVPQGAIFGCLQQLKRYEEGEKSIRFTMNPAYAQA